MSALFKQPIKRGLVPTKWRDSHLAGLTCGLAGLSSRTGKVLSPLWSLKSSYGLKQFGGNTLDTFINKHKCSLHLHDRFLAQNQNSPLNP